MGEAGGRREREREWAVNRGVGAQPRQFHKGGKSRRFLKSVNFLCLSLRALLLLVFLDRRPSFWIVLEDVYVLLQGKVEKGRAEESSSPDIGEKERERERERR